MESLEELSELGEEGASSDDDTIGAGGGDGVAEGGTDKCMSGIALGGEEK